MPQWLVNTAQQALDFSNILNASIAASWMVLAVILLRLIFKKAPRWTHVALWGLVAVRLILPFSIESPFSLIPSTEIVPREILVYEGEALQNSASLDVVTNPVFPESITVDTGETVDRVQVNLVLMTPIWILGMVALLVYTVISYWRLRHKISEAVILRDNIFQSENVASPFVLGVFRPRIYLPYNMDGQDLGHVVAHEQAHIRRRDHWWKPLGFLLLTIHWFNPLMWLAYVLLCRDIELACDEKVIKKLGNEQRADYSQALVSCSVNRRMIAACPLAFGEVGVKERVKSVMNYKKPAFWVIVVSVITCAVVAVCFLTNPKTDVTPDSAEDGYFLLIGVDGVESIEITGINTSGGVVNADGSAFRNGEKVWLEPLQGVTDLRGYSITALGKNDEILYALSIPEGATNDEVVNLVGSDGWLLAPTDFESGLSGIAGKTFLYENEGIMGSFSITLYEDGTFTYYEGMASSYIGIGSWEQNSDTITLTDDVDGGYGLVNHFKFDGETLTFVEKGSDNFIYVKVKDGEKFHCTGEAFKQNDSVSGTVQIMPSQKLSLNDVIILSQKGYDLTWSDFDNYAYIETGSGLYIRVYEINEMYELWIGGGWTDEDPMYIYLALADDLDTRIDIRDGGVTEFIGADHSEVLLTKAIHDAILVVNKTPEPDGLYHCASFALLSLETVSGTPLAGAVNHMETVTVYGLALHQAYGFSGATFHEVMGSHIPVAITFEVVDGKYVLKEYWRPGDGTYYVPDIREKFPDEIEDEAIDTQKYILAQKQECYDQAVRYGGVDTYSAVEHLFEVIESSPATSSKPADYIDAHPIEYRELMYYGDYTLQYIFSKFHLEGNQTGLRGHLMRIVLDDLAPEAQLRLYAETGQGYFDEWRAGAIRISEQHDMDWIKENQPAIWLFLRMDGE